MCPSIAFLRFLRSSANVHVNYFCKCVFDLNAIIFMCFHNFSCPLTKCRLSGKKILLRLCLCAPLSQECTSSQVIKRDSPLLPLSFFLFLSRDRRAAASPVCEHVFRTSTNNFYPDVDALLTGGREFHQQNELVSVSVCSQRKEAQTEKENQLTVTQRRRRRKIRR